MAAVPWATSRVSWAARLRQNAGAPCPADVAGRSQAHALAAALEQLGLQLLLQLLDGHGQRRLRDDSRCAARLKCSSSARVTK
jgi:hypothetical protein